MLNASTKIVINADLSLPAAEFAAENLRKYVFTAIGCPVTVNEKSGDYTISLVVDPECKGVKNDGFSIKNEAGRTTISAAVARGVLYGAYDFLERYFGIRFLAPDCEIVPKADAAEIPVGEYVSNPAFRLRGAYNGANRLDKEYYSKSRNHNQFEVVTEKYGGDCGWERVNGLKWATGHNSLCYVEKEKYGEKHPELFAHNRGEITDICFTSGVAESGGYDGTGINCVKIVSDYIKRRITEDGSLRYFMVGQTDSWEGYENECNCDKCRKAREKYKSSGVLVRFLNLVADSVNEFVSVNCPGREIYVMGFSYSQTFDAPVKAGTTEPIDETVVCRNNVIMWLCQSGGLDWGIDKYYSFTDEKHNAKSALNYKAWQRLCKKTMIWDYCANYSEYLWYYPTLSMTEESIRAAADTDCEYYMAQFGYADINEWQSLLKGYVASKQMWDPSLSREPLVKEFTDGYYGAGAPFVRKFMKLFDSHYQKLERKKGFYMCGTKSDDVLMNGNYYPEELLTEAERIIDDGINAVKKAGKGADVLIKRLNAVRLTPMRMRLYNYYMYDKNKRAVFPYFEKFKATAEESGIKSVGEGAGMETIEWQMKQIGELLDREKFAWDVYRYLYDGIVGNYRLPKRDKHAGCKEKE